MAKRKKVEEATASGHPAPVEDTGTGFEQQLQPEPAPEAGSTESLVDPALGGAMDLVIRLTAADARAWTIELDRSNADPRLLLSASKVSRRSTGLYTPRSEREQEYAAQLKDLYTFLTSLRLDRASQLRPAGQLNSYVPGIQGAQGALPILEGVTLITGDSSSGKSTIARHVTNAMRDWAGGSFAVDYSVYCEPELGASLDSSQLIADIALNLVGAHDGMVIDSLKDFVFAESGSTGAGGVNMTLFRELTRLDVLAQAFGLPLVVVLNILTVGDSAHLKNASRGSVTCAIHADTPGACEVSSRAAGDRNWLSYKYERVATFGMEQDPFSGSELFSLDLKG